MCLLRASIKGADVTVSRPVPSPGPSFQLTSEQFIHGAGRCEGSGVVSTRTGGAFSLSAMTYELATTVEHSIVEDPLTADWQLLFL